MTITQTGGSRTPGDSTPGHGPGLDTLMIQRARAAHVPYLRRLKERVMRDRYQPADDAEEFARWRDTYCTDDHFRELLDMPESMLLFIGTLREPSGMVVLQRHHRRLEVDDLLVLHPRRGDGTRLLLSCLRYAEAWRMNDVFIDVYPGHEAVDEFLTGHGFVTAEETANELGRPMQRYVRHVD